jgi:hypothetical protein
MERSVVSPASDPRTHGKKWKMVKYQDIMEVVSTMESRGYVKKCCGPVNP